MFVAQLKVRSNVGIPPGNLIYSARGSSQKEKKNKITSGMRNHLTLCNPLKYTSQHFK